MYQGKMKLNSLFGFICIFMCLIVQGEEAGTKCKLGESLEYALKGQDATVQDALQMGSMPLPNPQSSPRRRLEKVHLMRRIARNHGKWGPSHPRYRLLEALFGFVKYRDRNMAEVDRWRKMYKRVSKKQKHMLESVVNYKKKLDDLEELVYHNEVLCKSIVAHAMSFYGIEQKELDAHIKEAEKSGRVADKVSVVQALKHYVRDWSEEGSKERNEAFPCIKSALSGIGYGRAEDGGSVKVLLPGSGLGRLGNEIANLQGFEVTVNEWSMYMNIAYRYMEARKERDSIAVYPFIDSLSHHATTRDLQRRITAPDMEPHPSVLLVEGDFTTVFADQNSHYDVIVTHFFIDTARNLMSYFETIHRLLKTGGHWVNFGPLLYGTGPFVQLSLDEILAVLEKMGFEFEELDEQQCGNLTFEGQRIRWKEAEYGFNVRALTSSAYKAQTWLARKV